jgi:ketosteroid isomerase-like protein
MTNKVGIAKNLYAAFGRGDIEAVLAMFDPDIQWKPAEGHPYQQSGAAWIGPQEVLDNLFLRIGTEWDGFTVNIGTLHDAGDHVVMEGRYTGTFKPSGRSIDAQACHVLHFINGKLRSFHQYMDTAQLQAAMVR